MPKKPKENFIFRRWRINPKTGKKEYPKPPRKAWKIPIKDLNPLKNKGSGEQPDDFLTDEG